MALALMFTLKRNVSYNTSYSQVVSYPSTRLANTRLTSEIGRDPVELACMVVAEWGLTKQMMRLQTVLSESISESISEYERLSLNISDK